MAVMNILESKAKVYVAGPYTIGDPAVNTRNMILACDMVLESGFVPYCPLLTHFWHFISPKHYQVWCAYDLVWVEACDCLLRIPGESSGADKEIEYALKLNKPVFYSIQEMKEYYA
jgi:hypothetical protein